MIRRSVNGGPPLRQHQPKHEEAVLHEFDLDLRTSSRVVARRLGINQSLVNRITQENGLKPYHLKPVQQLHPGDEERRSAFCQELARRYEADAGFIERILWTDELCFTKTGIRSFHNEHFDSERNEKVKRV